jgi:hypothetical protein
LASRAMLRRKDVCAEASGPPQKQLKPPPGVDEADGLAGRRRHARALSLPVRFSGPETRRLPPPAGDPGLDGTVLAVVER